MVGNSTIQSIWIHERLIFLVLSKVAPIWKPINSLYVCTSYAFCYAVNIAWLINNLLFLQKKKIVSLRIAQGIYDICQIRTPVFKHFSFPCWIVILVPANKRCYWLPYPACFRDITVYVRFLIFVYPCLFLVLFVNHFLLWDNLSDFDFFNFTELCQVATNVAI